MLRTEGEEGLRAEKRRDALLHELVRHEGLHHPRRLARRPELEVCQQQRGLSSLR